MLYVHCFHCFHELCVAVQQALSDLARLDGDSDQAFQAGALVPCGSWRRFILSVVTLVVLFPSKPAETALLHMYDIEKRTPG